MQERKGERGKTGKRERGKEGKRERGAEAKGKNTVKMQRSLDHASPLPPGEGQGEGVKIGR
jgi:hypothetical protein